MGTLRGRRVLISGAGVAGPALAHWLSRYGASATVVEVAPALRTSGFAVDFRGPTHLGVLSRMGILDELREVQTHAGEMSFVDSESREIFRLPSDFAGGDIEVLRRDLSRVLVRSSGAEYMFGDTITALHETREGVRVEFERSPSKDFDLVVGADGLHSTVRRLAFGPERSYVRHLGYSIAGWDLPNDLGVGATPQHYNEPGRMISVGADLRDPEWAGASAVFRSPPLDYGRCDLERQKALIAEALEGLGWHTPWLVAGLRAAPELYFDAICRVSVPRWTTGRIALLGDAAWGVTLGGMGVGAGIVGAYVLAGELAMAGGDHRAGFEAYEKRLRAYAGRWQRTANPGRFLAPGTAWGLRLRDWLMRRKSIRRMMTSGTERLAADTDLPEYSLV